MPAVSPPGPAGKRRKPAAPPAPTGTHPDPAALVLAHASLVHSVIRQERARCPALARMEYDDLAQEGMLAAWRAARAFIPERGLQFTTLCTTCVQRHLWAVSERSTRPRFAPDGGRMVASLDAITDCWQAAADGKLHGWRTFDQPDGRAADPVAEAMRGEASEDVAAALAVLEEERPRWALVLRLRVCEGLTLGDVGRVVGRSKERVRQVQAKAGDRLRAILQGARRERTAGRGVRERLEAGRLAS